MIKARASDQPTRSGSRWAFTVLGVFLLALVTAACGGEEAETAAPEDPDAEADEGDAEADEAFPEDNIRDVIPVDVGGGLDTASRAYQRFWEERLGVQINVENVPGASHAIGLQSVADTGQDCNTVATTAIPHLLYSYLTQDVDFDYENTFYPVGAVQTQPAAIVVAADSEYETIDDLLADIQARPGEVRASVSGLANNNYAGLLQMQELLGAEINIVGYDGGGPARNAIIAGEVEFTHAAIFAALTLGDEIRFLAIHQETNEYEDLIGDVPTLSEATGEDFGANQSTYGVFAHRECYDEYPERYQVLVDTFRETLEDAEYQESLVELEAEDAVLILEPDEYHEQILDELGRTEQAIEASDELDFVD